MSCSLSSAEAWQLFEEAQCPEWVRGHVELVRSLAVNIATMASRAPDRPNIALVEVGAILHDVGRAKTQNPTHAFHGATWLRQRGIDETIAQLVERHTGAGLTSKDAAALGLPPGDYVPEKVEEKIVAHADNLCSGSNRVSMEFLQKKYAAQGLHESFERIEALHEEITRWIGCDPTSVL